MLVNEWEGVFFFFLFFFFGNIMARTSLSLITEDGKSYQQPRSD